MIRRGLLGGLVLLIACSVPVRVETFGPDFEATRTVRLRGNVVPTPVAGVGGIELNAERVARPEQPPEYALLVEVRAEELRIRPGASLRLMLNGDTVVLARDSTATYWPRVDPTIEEQARYPAADSLLLRLAGAEAIRMEVQGAGWWEARRLSRENLEVLSEFVRTYVVPDTAVVDSVDAGTAPRD